MRYQRTIKRIVTVKGIGLHTGRKVNMKLVPAPENTGIVFIRRDLGCRAINVNISSVVDTRLSTNLRSNGAEVKTVEHLLASLSGLGLDNVYVELDAPEVPIM
ncbi:MAG TPA: UDP-3-O-acyl-N-acetylglucosamine deacetylase, partial [Thermodesulfovibrionia bacterium]|nr:UDP-3-O-acyl-N-acetylglucosamine deacetylase [Thermodesulfovibrionia bacterium]